MSENVSIGEVCRLLETLDEWEEVALHLGLSDKTIQEIRGLSGGNSLRREVMVLRWVQREDLEPSWSKLEDALVLANQEPHAATIRARQRTPTNPAITATSSDNLKEASDNGKETEALLSTVDNKTLTEDDWNIVSVECGSLAAKWEQLSACLGLAKANIDRIKESGRDIAGCWSEALSQWIKQNYSTQRFGLPSWRSLLKAVATVDRRLCKELAAQHQTSDTYKTLQLLSESAVDNVQPPARRQQSMEMIRSNVNEIKALFSSLVLEVQSALQSQSDIRKVRHFLITFFKCDFPETTNLEKLFTTVTLSDLWDYNDHNPLEQLINKFLPSNQEVGCLMKAYKARLSGFYLTTMLIDYIEYQNLSADDSDEECDQPSPKLTTKLYKKIKVVLQPERKISQVSLDYVVKLWQSFAEEYEIPSLTAVIDKIVAGSLEVTWTVPQYIVDAICPRSKFFRSHGIVLVSIDDVIIYDEKQMAAKEKRFLELCYDSTADISDISSLLAQGVDPNIYDQHGNHPLWCVSYDGRQDLVELFIKYRADIDMPTRDDFGETALVTAVNKGHLHVAETLVKNGADVNYRNKKEYSVLWKASIKGHTEIVLLLLRHHAAVDLPNDDEYGATALFAACSQGHYDLAVLLIDHGADVNYLSKSGTTPMYLAAQYNHPRLVELLLAHGVDINKGEQSPLYVTSFNGNIEMVQLLVHHHAAIDQPTDGEYAATPLIIASAENHIEVIRFLVEHGASVNYQNKYGYSALHTVCDRGNTDIVKLLIQSNANIELKNKEGRTGLMIAAWRGYSSIVAELIRAGAQIDAQDQNGLTAYDFASSRSHAAVCQLLEQYGYEPSHRSSHLVPAALQSTSRQYDPVTSLQTFRDILEHGSKLSDIPAKGQKSDNAPQQHSYDETAS